MTQLPNYLLWVGQGREIADKEFRGKPVDRDSYYVTHGHNDSMGIGLRIAAGPFPTEHRALYEARSMTDTSGT